MRKITAFFVLFLASASWAVVKPPDNRSQDGFGVTLGGDAIFADVSVNGTLNARDGVRIGSLGSGLTKISVSTATLDFGATAGSSCDLLTLTVPNVGNGDEVLPGIPVVLVASDQNAIFSAYASAVNTVTVKRCCVKTTACTDPAAAIVEVIVIKGAP